MTKKKTATKSRTRTITHDGSTGPVVVVARVSKHDNVIGPVMVIGGTSDAAKVLRRVSKGTR